MAPIQTIVTSVNLGIGEEHSLHQIHCVANMRNYATQVAVLNDPGNVPMANDLANYVEFIDYCDDPPTIQQAISVALGMDYSRSAGPIAIVNSDISIGPNISKLTQAIKPLGKAWAATSFRYEVNEDGSGEPTVEGQGLDIFVMSPRIAHALISEMPSFLTFGRAMWDNWVNCWMLNNLKETHYFDMTPWRCIIHKKHARPANRLANYSENEVALLKETMGNKGGIPKQKYLIGNG